MMVLGGSIDEDQNFYSVRRRPVLSPDSGSLSSDKQVVDIDRHDQYQRQHQQHEHPHSHTVNNAPPVLEFENYRSPSRASQVPASRTAMPNLEAVASNARFSRCDPSQVDGSQEPDAFYRNQSRLSKSSNNKNDDIVVTEASLTSLRSNGIGITPKHPALPTLRTHLKPTTRSTTPPLPDIITTAPIRSFSSPISSRGLSSNTKSTSALNVGSNKAHPSVKDLLKRFDQNKNKESSASIALKPPKFVRKSATTEECAERLNTFRCSTSHPYKQHALSNTKPAAAASSSSSSSPPSSSTASSSSSSSSSSSTNHFQQRSPASLSKSITVSSRTKNNQRVRSVVGDKHPKNKQSSPSRSVRPRHSFIDGSHPSYPMTNHFPLLPGSPSYARGPLFGEVLPVANGNLKVAHGIPRLVPRRLSDPSLPAARSHQRQRSDLDSSCPSYPSTWYLENAELNDLDCSRHPRSKGHNRNHSDFADNQVNTLTGVSPTFQTSSFTAANATTTTGISRLPVAKSRLSNGVPSLSPTSLVCSSNSSTSTKLSYPAAKLRNSPQPHWVPAAGRVRTGCIETPTLQSPPRKAIRPPDVIANNASLQAFISAPSPPVTSPALRSSRPRVPISNSRTASHLNRRSSPHPQQTRTGMKVTRNVEDQKDMKGERKIPDLPLEKIDFATRRQTIQRAYTNRLKEDEQKQIRAENRRRLETKMLAAADFQDTISPPEVDASEPPDSPAYAAPPPLKNFSPQRPLYVNTVSYSSHPNHDPEDALEAENDSPTLGIPGSFIYYDEPSSAISNVTRTTEIENEPQTKALQPNEILSKQTTFSCYVGYLQDELSPDQAYHGMQNLGGELKNIMLAGTPPDEQHEFTSARKVSRDPYPPGAFLNDDDDDDDDESNHYVDNLKDESLIFTSKLVTLNQNEEPETINSSDPSPTDETCLDTSVATRPPSPAAHEKINHTPDEKDNCTSDSSDVMRLHLPVIRTALDSRMSIGDSGLYSQLTDMECEATSTSDACVVDQEDHYSTFDLAPSQGYQLSNHSSWRTDCSVRTCYDSSSNQEPSVVSGPGINHALSSDLDQKPAPPPKDPDLSPKVPPKPDGYSPLPSPLFHRVSASPLLPPVVTGEDFSLSFLYELNSQSSGTGTSETSPDTVEAQGWPRKTVSRASSTRQRVTPPANFYNRRPTSTASTYGRNLDSRPVSSEVCSPQISISTTPRSSTHASLHNQETSAKSSSISTDQPEATPSAAVVEKEISDETRKRLKKRMMTIKELIDTESVYLKDMNVVEEIYKGTAEACPNLGNSDIKIIFRNTTDIVAFSTIFLDELKASVSSIYSPRTRKVKTPGLSIDIFPPGASDTDQVSTGTIINDENEDEEKDRSTTVGAAFGRHITSMQEIYTEFLKHGEAASTRLCELQKDPAVKVWLIECNSVAKDLTAAWDLDALLVKPVQRITRYQLLLMEIKKYTTDDHPDSHALLQSITDLGKLLSDIDSLKERLQLVGKIIGRKRKESRTGITKAFKRTTERSLININRPKEDEIYTKLQEKYGEDYLRQQVVIRDVEFYIRQSRVFVADFLRYLSSMELAMRTSPSSYPEIESKWTRFNMFMRDMGSHVIEDHVREIRRLVVEPIETCISLYEGPSLTIKKRNKRRLDYEKALSLRSQGKKVDKTLEDLSSQYDALNAVLKNDLPLLSKKTELIGQYCGKALVCIQARWYSIWVQKVQAVLEENEIPKDIADILDKFSRDYKYVDARLTELGITNGTFRSEPSIRGSESTSRSRGQSQQSERSPVLCIDGPYGSSAGYPHQAPTGWTSAAVASATATATTTGNIILEHSRGSVSPTGAGRFFHSPRPDTGRSFTSETGVRASSEHTTPYPRPPSYHSGYRSPRPLSGLFQSALPVGEGYEDGLGSSRSPSRDRSLNGNPPVMFLAASLFEFNITCTKIEAGFPYLMYGAGEIFDVLAEKGELWLAKNQDDTNETVGWIWSKHFARLAAN